MTRTSPRRGVIARLTPGKDVFGSEALPDWQRTRKGWTWSSLSTTPATDHALRRRVGSRRVRASGRRTLLPAEFHVRTLLRNRDPTNTNNAYYGLNGYQETVTVALEAAVVREAHRGVHADVPTPNHHYSFCEGGNYTTGLGVLSGSQTDVVIADHITGDSAHALKWSGRFEQFRACPPRARLTPSVLRGGASLGSRSRRAHRTGFSVTPWTRWTPRAWTRGAGATRRRERDERPHV